jgi:methionyl aminopeptidase
MILSAQQINDMQEGGTILSTILKELVAYVKPGMSTNDFDVLARERMQHYGVKPSFLGYNNFPAVLCTSINEQAVHAIPTDRKLEEGDLFKIDIGIVHKGLHTDTAVTVLVSDSNAVGKFFKRGYSKKKKLIAATRDALMAGIAKARVGNTIGDIGQAISDVVEDHGFVIVRELGGHGIGTRLHEDPFIPNYRDGSYNDPLVVGMAIAIEPIVSLSSSKIKDGDDGFAYSTKDDSLSAHFEHTIIVTEKAPIIVTQ